MENLINFPVSGQFAESWICRLYVSILDVWLIKHQTVSQLQFPDMVICKRKPLNSLLSTGFVIQESAGSEQETNSSETLSFFNQLLYPTLDENFLPLHLFAISWLSSSVLGN